MTDTPTLAEIEALVANHEHQRKLAHQFGNHTVIRANKIIIAALRAYAATFAPQATPTCEHTLDTDAPDNTTGFRCAKCGSWIDASAQASPVGKSKPMPEMLEKGFDFAAKWCNPEYFYEGEAQDMADEFANALAAEAHKAALAADARVAEMREECARIAKAAADNAMHRKEVAASGALNNAAMVAIWQADTAASIEAGIRALPLPTGRRFMDLLDAAESVERAMPGAFSDLTKALSAFKEPAL